MIRYYGGGPDNPVIYKDIRIGKDLLLNYNGMDSVARYRTYLNLPAPIVFEQDPRLEVPAIHLNKEFSNISLYNPDWADPYPDITSSMSGCASAYTLDPGKGFRYGGIIASTPDLQYAMGLFGARRGLPNGYVDYIDIFNSSNCDHVPEAQKTFKLSAAINYLWGYWDVPTNSTYDTFVITGTREQVRQKMSQLYALLR